MILLGDTPHPPGLLGAVDVGHNDPVRELHDDARSEKWANTLLAGLRTAGTGAFLRSRHGPSSLRPAEMAPLWASA